MAQTLAPARQVSPGASERTPEVDYAAIADAVRRELPPPATDRPDAQDASASDTSGTRPPRQFVTAVRPDTTGMSTITHSLPMLAGMAAAIPTAGASLPIALGAPAAAGAIGSLMRSWLESDTGDTGRAPTTWEEIRKTLPEALQTATREAFTQAVLSAGGEFLKRAAPGAKRLARNLWVRAAKPTDALLKRTGTMLAGGTMDEAADQVAETALSSGLGSLTPKNVQAMSASIEDLDAQLTAVIASSTKTVPKQALEQSLLDFVAKADYEHQLPEMLAAQRAWDDLAVLPAQIPIQRAQAIKRAIYAQTPYVAGRLDAAGTAVDKTLGRTLRSEIAAAEPTVGPVNAEMSKRIPAAKTMAAAVKRAGNRNPLSLTESVLSTAGAAGTGRVAGAALGAAGLVNRPGVLSPIAQRIYQLAPLLEASGVIAPNAVRALLALISQGEPRPHQNDSDAQ